jgi:excisionase family DNA binding protein
VSTEAWVSVDAVAKHLSVAKDSIYRWIEHKRLPAHRIGRLWKFKLSQIDEWVRAGGATSAPVAQPPPPPEQIRDRLDTMLSAAFAAEPVEDGVAHQAERILERALDTGDQSTALGIVATLCVDTARPGFSAATLRCLGRLPLPGSSAWRSAVVRGALAHSDVELRDAAVQAAESWGDPNVLDVLLAHREAERWLAEYISEVTEDLQA